MIENYMNQTATWQHVTGTNDYGEYVYAASQLIKCRFETGNKLVRNKQGAEVVSSATVFTKSPVTQGDKVNGELVLSVGVNYKLNGLIGFYEAALI